MRVLIIGGSSGIGRELARQYAQQPETEVGVTARRADLLSSLQNEFPERIKTCVSDITAPDALARLEAFRDNTLGGADLILYSAGWGHHTPDFDNNVLDRTVALNITAFSHTANWAYAYFAKRKSGHFAAIGSIAGLRGIENTNGYGASKAYMANYMEGLRRKSRHEDAGVVISTIVPGFVQTAMASERAFWNMPVAAVAAQIRAGLKRKKGEIIVTHRWKLVAGLLRMMPNWIFERIPME